MRATLFVTAASNSSLAGRLALDLKGIEYRRIELPPMIHRPIVRALGFPGHRVPALIIRGERVQGTRPIVRALDRLQPEPPLLPDDPEQRRAVEEVERFGEEELQPILRWIQPWAVFQRPEAMASMADGLRSPLPPAAIATVMRPNVVLGMRRNPSNQRTVRDSLARLPGMLARIDGWIAEGLIGGKQPNAGDVQVASTLRVLLNYDDLAPHLRDRPCGRLALRLLPEVPGRVPAVFPEDALAALRGG